MVSNSKENLKVSIITVCYNCEKELDNTMLSVINQAYKNIEYILVDGKSSDGTLKIIKKFAENDTRIKYVSEKDRGIYDAMNKGINMANGDVIYFLNSGDVLYDKNVINNVMDYFNTNDCDIVYGDLEIKHKEKNEVRLYGDINKLYFLKNRMICHQCIFAKKKAFKNEENFDINYKICADKDWFINCFKLKYKIKHIHIIVSSYDRYGFSSMPENRKKIDYECGKIIRNHFGIISYFIFRIIPISGAIKINLKGKLKFNV